jgi:hypothetical protein
VQPGALTEEYLPNVVYLNLQQNSLTMIESETFSGLPRLEELWLYANRANTTVWFLETSLPIFRYFVPTESGLASIQPGAFCNDSALTYLGLDANGFASIESLGGALEQLTSLQRLNLNGNHLSCTDLALHYKGECTWHPESDPGA